MMTNTSLMSYDEDFSMQRERILCAVGQSTCPTSRTISLMTGIPRTSVTGRLRELEKRGRVMKSTETIIDPRTGKKVHYYKVVSNDV